MINNKDTTFTNKVNFNDKVGFNNTATFNEIRFKKAKISPTDTIQAVYNSSNKTFSVLSSLSGLYCAIMYTSQLPEIAISCLVYFNEEESTQYVEMPMFDTENQVSIRLFAYSSQSGTLIPRDNSNLFDDCEIIFRRLL